MDLIEKIENIVSNIGLESPIIDIHFDNQKNIVGYITSESYKSKSDYDSQKEIWTTLKKNLSPSELLKVIAIFNETPLERVQRINGITNQDIQFSKFWFHETPRLEKYRLFIDVAKFEDEFKSFYLIINEKRNISKGLTFVYTKEILDFMELEQEEIHMELYTNTFNNAVNEIKIDLMAQYEKLTKQQLWGRSNIYWYVYENFQLDSISKNAINLNEIEIKMLEESIKKLDDFSIKDDIKHIIKFSKERNKIRRAI